MGHGSIAKIPLLGTIEVPVHLMIYEKKEKGKRDKSYMCGFAHFRYQDCLSTVPPVKRTRRSWER